jgi:hypothetical protein
MKNISEVTIKIMSVPTNVKQDAMRKLNLDFSRVAWIHTTHTCPINAKDYFTEPHEFVVTLGVIALPEVVIGC